MRLRKRIISIIMTIALVIGTVFGGGVIPANAAITGVKTGSIFTSGKYRYKVVSVSEKSGTVSLIGAKSKKLAVVEMPDTVKKNGCTFTVTEIGNNAFKGYKKLTSVTTNTELKKIGKNAFNGCKKLSEIDIESTKLVKVGKNALKGIAAEATVEVPEGKENSYSKLLKKEVKNSDANAQPETTEQSQETEQIEDMDQSQKTEQPGKSAQSQKPEQPKRTEHTHSFTNYVYNEDATCMEDGTETAVCDGCDVTDTRTKVGSALGHSFGEWQVKVDATCEETGSKEHICSVCGAVETEVIEALGHDMQGVETVEPTCTEDGRITNGGKCSRCGYEGEKIVLSALGHSFTNYVYNGDATCTEDGTETAKCDRCEETDTRTASGTMKPHSFADWVTKTEATCTVPGSKERVCSVCGAVDTETIDALGHDMQPWATIEPTCTGTGRKYLDGKCSRCGYVGKTESIPALGHSFTNYVYNDDATCAKDGTETAKCDRCDKTDTRTKAGTKKEHTFGEWVVKQEALSCKAPGYKERTCTVCGYAVRQAINKDHRTVKTEHVDATCLGYGKDYYECKDCGQVFFNTIPEEKPLGHAWETKGIEPTCTTEGYTVTECTRCHVKKDALAVEEALGHDYSGEWVIDQEATCGKPGQRSRKCSRCDSRETEVIPATGEHQYVDNEPCSCAAPGYWSKICKVCGKKAGEYMPAPEHQLKKTTLQPATCTDYGKQYSVCENCGQVFFHIIKEENGEPARPLGHDWKEVTVPATCTTDGYTVTECTRCHEKKDVVVTQKKLGHDYSSGEWVVEKEPTCKETGLRSIKCSRCDSKKTDVIPSDGTNHSFGESVVTKEPTCTSWGVRTKTCEYCGLTQEEIISAKGHKYDFDNESITKEPTCEEPGRATVTCKDCGYENTSYTIPATGHKWGGPAYAYDADEVALTSSNIAENPGTEGTGKVVGDNEVNENCSFRLIYEGCQNAGCKAKRLINIQNGNGHKWEINEDHTTAQCTNSGWWQHYYGNDNYGEVENCCPVNRWIKNRLVWAVVAKVDSLAHVKLGDGWITYGGNNEYAAIVKTTIMSTGDGGEVESYDVDKQNKITITAPEPAEGYQFVGWRDLQTKAMVEGASKTITFTWKDMGKMYEAVYEPVGK